MELVNINKKMIRLSINYNNKAVLIQYCIKRYLNIMCYKPCYHCINNDFIKTKAAYFRNFSFSLSANGKGLSQQITESSVSKSIAGEAGH